MTIGERTKAFVRSRAENRCEYCQLHQDNSPLASLHVEHIIPKKHRGSDDDVNLALACSDCNLHKGPNLTGLDPETGKLTELFHPRKQKWNDHFCWLDLLISGLTDVGRTTVLVLEMNSDEQVALRRE